MRTGIFLLLCVAVTFTPGHCETKVADDDESRAKLPEFLSELDLEDLEASEEDVEALKRIVKRLAPEKNGEYQVYQVFFGNEDLLKEWLKGAGVTGQPGVDFPALTTIPVTSFSCRGLKGGYYADLETNCQVFHICDNGRKISFLCPNGTIFQQSQLICDWWFKVDCSKSVELYEQSAEQLAQEERKRAETRKMKSEFHRTTDKDKGQTYNQNENADYDGRQNGRVNPYAQSAKQNQIQDSFERGKSSQYNQISTFDQQSNTRNGNQFINNNSNNNNNNNQNNYNGGGTNENANLRPQPFFQTNGRQQNKLSDEKNNKAYDQRGQNRYQSTSQDYQESNQDRYNENENSGRKEKPSAFRNPKARPVSRTNANNFYLQDQKVTPTYTETTTFRTSTSNPLREFQQLAESAAFVSNRGNRVNSKTYNSQNYNYQSYSNQVTNFNSKGTTTQSPDKNRDSHSAFRSRFNIPPFPGPTYSPIYKPKTTTLDYDIETETTTDRNSYTTDYYRLNYQETTYPPTDAPNVTNQDYQTTTYPPNGNYRQNYNREQYTTTQRPYNDYSNNNNYRTNNYKDNTVTTRDVSQDTGTYSTTRSYVNTETYRNQNSVTESYRGTATTPAYFNGNQGQSTGTFDNRDGQSGSSTRSSSRTSQNYRQNSISGSTEKPSRSTQTYQQNGAGKTLSPYDTSFTYKQGKVMSTLGPYVPFTKNYIFSSTSTTTTPRPPAYTATVPTYSSTIANYRSTTKNLLPKIQSSTASPSEARTAATYLPKPNPTKRKGLENRPVNERQHALSMLQSLRGLENNIPSLGSGNGSWGGPTIPTSSGPSTLHSLALYFATANDNFTSNETTDSAIQIELKDSLTPPSKLTDASIQLPTSILTQHTINSYAELFNLNNALEGNGTTDYSDEENLDEDDEFEDDLDIQQSEGPLAGARKTNSTKLRELAQVFTHALSAYLQDPETFKKVLAEIRPTEPSASEESDSAESTTTYPTTYDEYPSVTKEKDEVLEYSDDLNASRRRKPTTIFPITTQPTTTVEETTFNSYYTTVTPSSNAQYQTVTPVSNDLSVNAQSNFYGSTTQSANNAFAYSVNNAFNQNSVNDITNYNSASNGPSEPQDESYFPDYSETENKLGGFQNNTASTYEPYGKHVKPFDATPIGDNYVSSSTPATYVANQQTSRYTEENLSSRQPDLELTPPRFQPNYENANAESSRSSNPEGSDAASTTVYSTTPVPRRVYELTTQPFRIRYYDTTSQKPNDEFMATARTSYMNFRSNYGRDNSPRSTENPSQVSTTETYGPDPVTTSINDADISLHQNTVARDAVNNAQITTKDENSSTLGDNHWTSSPQVTQLWETTVFIDPKHINHGLESEETSGTPITTTNFVPTERMTRNTTPSPRDRFATDASSDIRDFGSNQETTEWQWTPKDNDSPTAFTLLPTALNSERTATPTPIYTTKSSITTTITSSVSATSAVPQDNLSSLLPYTVAKSANLTENEIVKAQEMFGGLNETSTNTLMRVMKQADKNETVRQLVLLLITHCNGPMNKTMEEEKEQLLNALLRLPVNEFTSDESREIVAGINRLKFPLGGARVVPLNPSQYNSGKNTATTVRPADLVATTFRSRRGRKFRTTTDNPSRVDRRTDETDDNSLSQAASDNRALELLRSLYTIAAKWG
ncbi:uncharacterized protein [Prorops nasuta]